MNQFARYGAWGLLTATLSATTSSAEDYYTKYTFYPTKGYEAAYYYYKPNAAAPAYRYHYCIHYPGEPFVYYYDPNAALFWARYDLNGTGFSLLDAKDRKGNLKNINHGDFPKPVPVINNPGNGNQVPQPPMPPAPPDQ